MVDNKTMMFNFDNDKTIEASEVILSVYNALKEKGYDPISQMVGYMISGDPTYITNHNNARGIIRRLERDELLEELVKAYVKHEK
jgi:uncharacterized protein (UPF0297 family)